GRPDLPRDDVTRAEVEASDLARGNVDVVGTRKVVVIGRPQEAEPVGEDLQDTLTRDETVLLSLRLQDGENEILLAHRRRAFDVHVLGDGSELADLLVFE